MSARSASIDRADVFWVGPNDWRRPRSRHPSAVVQNDVFNHSRVAMVTACADVELAPSGRAGEGRAIGG